MVTSVGAVDVQARLIGTPQAMARFLQDWPLELSHVRHRDRDLEVTVYVRTDVVDAALRAGLKAEVLRDLSAEMRTLRVGQDGRFAHGAVPQGLGLRPRRLPR